MKQRWRTKRILTRKRKRPNSPLHEETKAPKFTSEESLLFEATVSELLLKKESESESERSEEGEEDEEASTERTQRGSQFIGNYETLSNQHSWSLFPFLGLCAASFSYYCVGFRPKLGLRVTIIMDRLRHKAGSLLLAMEMWPISVYKELFEKFLVSKIFINSFSFLMESVKPKSYKAECNFQTFPHPQDVRLVVLSIGGTNGRLQNAGQVVQIKLGGRLRKVGFKQIHEVANEVALSE